MALLAQTDRLPALERSRPLEHLDDLTLVTLAASDSSAFAELFDRNAAAVYRYCYARLHNRDAAEDATSQVFERAFASLRKFDAGRGGFRPWLFRIAHNVVIDHFRLRTRRPTIPLDMKEITADARANPEWTYLKSEQLEEIYAAVQLLPDGDRQVIELRLAGLTTAEIASTLGRSRGAIDSAQFRAVTRLRQLLTLPGNETEGRR